MNKYQVQFMMQQLEYIKEEARATRGTLSMYEAVRILIHERYERHILSKDERDYLLHEITVAQL